MDHETARRIAERIVSEMTVYEKISQLVYNSPAIERLGIKEYNWWNEGSHGVARAGVATVFPHAIALAATFDPELVGEVAEAISTEARAKYNKSIQYEDRDIYKGLTYWSPNINIFRDPRWGRGQETFGEDPCLSATLAVEYIKGLQGNGEFLKACACAKHYAVHSGPEKLRHEFNAQVSKQDLFETYLPAFEYSVRKAKVAGVMGAYNMTNGEPCCANRMLMVDILRGKWGFEGYYVSDCGAIANISETHKFTRNLTEASALALKTGCDLNCGEAYSHLVDAYEEDLVTEEDITRAVTQLYTIRAMLGEFEEKRPYSDVTYDKLDSEAHKRLNLEAAGEGIVLLENKDGALPLDKKKVKKIAVIGPNAMSIQALEGNYNGTASEYITVADGIRREFDSSEVTVAMGSNVYEEHRNWWHGFGNLLSEGLAAASEAEWTVLCLGLDREVEGEETGKYDDYTDGGDKRTLFLPKTQMKLAESVCDVCKNVIVVVMCGSAADLGEKVRSRAKAILHAWYPGAVGGLAVAKIISGNINPSGKLPVTFYREEDGLPEFTDYSMDGRTYRFIKKKPLYPFGYGLGYAKVNYEKFEIISCGEEEIRAKVTVRNESERGAAEKIQIYARYKDSRTRTPEYQLCAVKSVKIAPKEVKTEEISIDTHWLKAVLEDGNRVTPNGSIELFAGGHQPDERSVELCGDECLKIKIK